MAQLKTTFFAPKFLGKRTPKIKCGHAPKGKVWCNSLNRSGRYQLKYNRFLANFRISNVKKLLGADPPPVRCVLASGGHPPSTNCEIFRGKASYNPVTPNGDFTATFGDFKFGLVDGDRCVVAFNRRLAVTPKHRSQRFCTTRNANRPTVLRRYSECTATVQRLREIVCDRS